MAILTLELEVVGAVWGFCRVFTAGFIRVVAAVIHAVALPNQTNAHSVLTLETELITNLVELRVLGASRKSCIFIRAIAALDDPVTNHGVKQALLAVLTHKVHEARAEGLAVLLIRAIRAILQTIAVFAGWDAGAIRAAESITLLLTVGRILIGTVLAVHVTVTCPPLGDAVPIVTLEVGGLTGMIDGSTVGFIRPVPAVVVPITHPGGADAYTRAAIVFVTPALVHFTVTFIAIVATVIFKITFVGQGNAGPGLLATKLGAQITNGSRAVSLIAHVSTVVVKITPPDAVDTVPVATAILVAETGILFFDTGVVPQLIPLRALTHQVPGWQDTAGYALWTPAALTAVGLGQAQQAAWPGHTGIASSCFPFVENLHVHQARELACQNRHLRPTVFGSSEYAEL